MLGILHAFWSSADCFQNQLFKKILSGIPSGCKTVLIQIRPDDLSGLIWDQTVHKVYQQTIHTQVGKALMKMYFIQVCKHGKLKDNQLEVRFTSNATCVSTCKFYVGLETKQGGRLSSQNKDTKDSSKHGRDKTKRQCAVSD